MKKKKINMQKIPFFKFIFILFVSLSFYSCDDDFIDTGAGLINTIELPPLYETDNLVAYSKRINRVQTNGLTMQSLADFDDPVYGNFKSSVLTQVIPNQFNNDFGTDPVLDSVILNLPFYSTQVAEEVYELDSVYGAGEVILKVYKSNQFLRDLSPGEDGEFTDSQVYYSDQKEEFLANIESEPIAVSEPINLEDYTGPTRYVERSGTETIDSLTVSPRIRLNLPVELFNEVIFDNIGSSELATEANFINFFRGLYFEVERVGGQGGLSLNFNFEDDDAGVVLHYQTQRPTTVIADDGEEEEPEFLTNWNKFRLNFEGIKVNLFEENFTIDVSSPNLEEGDENLYLKGGVGYYSVIEFFTGPDSDGDGVSDELQDLRDRNVLVNDANFDLYVNEELTDSINRVNRIMVFNLDQDKLIVDYLRDQSAGGLPSSSVISHLGPLLNIDGEGRRYRIRITDYMNQVITQDSLNAKLGIFVTDNVNVISQVEAETNDDELESVFRHSVQFTKGTVLHGSNTQNPEKQIKLKLQLTEIN